MYCYGSKEMKCVKESAQLFKKLVPSCQIYEAKGYNHGYLAIYLPDEWLKVVVPFLIKKKRARKPAFGFRLKTIRRRIPQGRRRRAAGCHG